MNFDLRKLRRHRHFKLAITGGLVIASLMSVIAPHLTHEIVTVNTMVNLFWVWEDSLE